MIPVIHSERLTFRDWRQSDFESFAAIYTDPEQSRFIGGAHFHAMKHGGRWPCSRATGCYAATAIGYSKTKPRSAFVGWSGLWFPEGFPGQEVGWTLVPAFRGRGLAQEAGKRVRRYAYDTLGWPSAISVINVGNDASARVAEKLGAVVERTENFRGNDCWIYRHPSAQSLAAKAGAA